MKIIIIKETTSREKVKTGYQAILFGKNPPVQSFAETEIQALKQLVDRLEKRNNKFIK
jgi:hypothetical protein